MKETFQKIINANTNIEFLNNNGNIHFHCYIQQEEIPKENISTNNKIIKKETYFIYKDGYIEPKVVYIEELNIYVAVCPVTFEEYDLYCSDKGKKCYAKSYLYGFDRGTYPVVNVSFDCALKYIKWLNEKSNKNYRLLTSNEWDLIASKNIIKDIDSLNNYIWCKDNTSSIQRVGLKKAGIIGIYDMYGNTHEWCLDRKIRGNSFKYALKEIYEKKDKLYLPEHSNNVLGFRIAKENI